jgi:hypothetical protein
LTTARPPVRPMLQARILPVGEDVMFKWRIMVEEGRKAVHPYFQPGPIIAATPYVTASPWYTATRATMNARE